jgi:pseudouridine kinase
VTTDFGGVARNVAENLARLHSLGIDTSLVSVAKQATHTLHLPGSRAGVTTAGAAGSAVWTSDDVRTMAALPAVPRDVTGAGDALIAGTLFGLIESRSLLDAAPLGLAAAITVESGSTTAEHLATGLLIAIASGRRAVRRE